MFILGTRDGENFSPKIYCRDLAALKAFIQCPKGIGIPFSDLFDLYIIDIHPDLFPCYNLTDGYGSKKLWSLLEGYEMYKPFTLGYEFERIREIYFENKKRFEENDTSLCL